MKKLIAMLLCLVLVLGLVACGSKTEEAAPAEEATEAAAPAEEAAEAPAEEAPAEEAPAEEAAEAPAAGDGNGASGHKVGFIQLTLGTTYHAAMSEKFEAICGENGVDVIMTCSQNRTAEEQLTLAEDLIAQGVEAMVLNPVGDEIVPSIATLCENAGIPLICVDNTSAGEGYTYVGIDNFAIARGIGQYVADHYDGGKTVYVRSTPTDTGCPAFRFGGVMGGLADGGEVARFELIDERYAPSDVGENDGLTQMEEMLAGNDDINVVIVHHDAQALGALTAINNAGRDDIQVITGFDGEKAFFDAMKENGAGENGPELVTGLNSPIMIAETTLDVLDAYFNGEAVGAEYLMPVVVVNYENVDEYYDYGF